MRNNDLVSREALLDIVGKMPLDWEYGKAVSDIYDIIKTAPAVDAVIMPCKIGEKVFCILHGKNDVVEDVVEDYDIWSIKSGIKLRLSLLNHNDYVIAEFGKSVFLTREEAEAALSE